METTFISIHNLSPDANILYASESIVEILGYNPEEVVGRSCFEYFHPDEVPFARNAHKRGVRMDKAAVLHYARIRSRTGQWVCCECVFTIVSDVLVSCTSIYKADEKNERKATEAPAVRRLFASAPKDPRYHMLDHLASKFKESPSAEHANEPRAALILNRFSRELPVMFATSAVESILGVRVDQAVGKSFYECIQEECHREAIRCLESAKANDSIAYLRFWYRDPRREEDHEEDMDEVRSQTDSSSDSDGGVELNSVMDYDQDDDDDVAIKVEDTDAQSNYFSRLTKNNSPGLGPSNNTSRTSSGLTSQMENDAAGAIFDGPVTARSSTSSLAPDLSPPAAGPYEIEAVVSCSSDGLVVVLRRASPRASLPGPPEATTSGVFAAPWAQQPVLPPGVQAHPQQQYRYDQDQRVPHVLSGGPSQDVLSSIRDVAVFAWSLVGINGHIANYGHGLPRGEAQPRFGLPIWEPNVEPAPAWQGPVNQAVARWSRYDQSIRSEYRQPGQGPENLQGRNHNPNSHIHNVGLGHQAQRYHQPARPEFASQLNNTGMTSLFEQMRQYHNPEEIDFEYQNYGTRGFHPRARTRRFQRGGQNGQTYSNYNNYMTGSAQSQYQQQQRFHAPSQQRSPYRHQQTHQYHQNNANGFTPYSQAPSQHQPVWDATNFQAHFGSSSHNNLGAWNNGANQVSLPGRSQPHHSGWSQQRNNTQSGANGHNGTSGHSSSFHG